MPHRPPLPFPAISLDPALAAAIALLQLLVDKHNQSIDSLAADANHDAATALNSLAIDPTSALGLAIHNLFTSTDEFHKLQQQLLEHRLRDRDERLQERDERLQERDESLRYLQERLRQQQESHRQQRESHQRHLDSIREQLDTHRQYVQQLRLAQEAQVEVLRSELRYGSYAQLVTAPSRPTDPTDFSSVRKLSENRLVIPDSDPFVVVGGQPSTPSFRLSDGEGDYMLIDLTRQLGQTLLEDVGEDAVLV